MKNRQVATDAEGALEYLQALPRDKLIRFEWFLDDFLKENQYHTTDEQFTGLVNEFKTRPIDRDIVDWIGDDQEELYITRRLRRRFGFKG